MAVAAPTTYAATVSLNSNVATTAQANASSDWDSILNDFEKYVDNYVRIMKKAQQGDPAAIADSMSLLETANKLSEKLENADDELTPAQMKRYTAILTKMTNATMSMY